MISFTEMYHIFPSEILICVILSMEEKRILLEMKTSHFVLDCIVIHSSVGTPEGMSKSSV